MEQHNSSAITDNSSANAISVKCPNNIVMLAREAKYRGKYPITTSTWDVVVKIFPLNNV